MKKPCCPAQLSAVAPKLCRSARFRARRVTEKIEDEDNSMGYLARISVVEPLETWPNLYSATCERYWEVNICQ